MGRDILWVMVILAFLAGLLCLLVPRFKPAAAKNEFHYGEHSVSSENVGAFLTVVSIIVGSVLALLSGLPSAASSGKSQAGPIPQPPTSTASASVPVPTSVSTSLSTTSSLSSSSGSSPGVPTKVARTTTVSPTTVVPRPTQSTTPSRPPWVGKSQGLTLTVERAFVSSTIPGREVLQVRLENSTGFGLAVPVDGFVAVDNRDVSYGEVDAKSTLVFDDDLSSYESGPFDDGTTRRGTVVLDANLTRGVSTLQVRFTVDYEDSDDSVQHFTVSTYTHVPHGAS